MNPTEMIGWIIGAISLLFSLYMYHQSKLSDRDRKFEISKLQSELRDAHNSTKNFAKSVYDLCFGAILRVKNYGSGEEGLKLQREGLASAIQAVIKLSSHHSKAIPFLGEYVWGGDLGALESSEGVKKIVLITPDLRPDREDQELIDSIRKNLSQGKKYLYLYPSSLNQQIVLEFEKNFKDAHDAGEIRVIGLDSHEYATLFEGPPKALYYHQNVGGIDESHIGISGFAEVVIPYEKRGSLWRRLDDIKCSGLANIAAKI